MLLSKKKKKNVQPNDSQRKISKTKWYLPLILFYKTS